MTPEQWNCYYHGAGSEGWRTDGETTTGGTKYCPAGKLARGNKDGHRPMFMEFSESECCQRTCWGAGWRDLDDTGSGDTGSGDTDGTYQCPASTVARPSHDQHDCGERCAQQSECCQKTCWLSGWRGSGDASGTNQCPATSNVRDSTDTYNCGDDCPQSECCKTTCGKSGFVDQSSCASGTQFRSEVHECWSSVARSSGLCQQGDCCSQTCSDAGYKTGGTMACPAGMAYRTDHHDCKMGECSDAQCCGVPKSSSGTCWETGFRDSTAETTQGAFQCPAGKVARNQDDGHICSGDTCFADDCCYPQCWASGWRAFGDASGSSQCPASSDARSSGDGHHCSNGVCDEDDCCRVQCWSSGWRDNGDSNGSHECPSGQMARDQDDGHGCSGGVCDASECCGETCAAIDPASCPAGKQRKRGEEICHGGACSTDHCCRVGCQVWADAGNTCSGDLALNTDERCDGDEISGCNAEKCCRHPLELKCQTSDSAGCSKCAKYAPCVSSIDPRCISQEALDCLYCKALGVIDCAVCTPEWDNKCYATEFYEDEACTDLKYSIPSKFDECYLQPFDASSGYSIAKTDGTYKSKCTDATCSSCEESDTFDFAEYKSSLAEGACTVEGDDNEGRKTRGLIDETKPGNPCPTAAPCGPASCVPGVDKKCIVFTVFGNASTCEVAEMTNSAVGEYHAFAIGDDTCRPDGNGRSYYKLAIDRDTDSGTGLIGCTDTACSVDCQDVAMTLAVCSKPSWSHGLQLVANCFLDDWEPLTPSPPSPLPPASPPSPASSPPLLPPPSLPPWDVQPPPLSPPPPSPPLPRPQFPPLPQELGDAISNFFGAFPPPAPPSTLPLNASFLPYPPPFPPSAPPPKTAEVAQQAAQDMGALTSTLTSLYGEGGGAAAPSLPPGSTAPPATPPPSLPPSVATSVLESVTLLVGSFSAYAARPTTASDGTAEGDADAKAAAQAEKEEVVAALTAGADLVSALLSAAETVGESTAVAATSALSSLVGGLQGQLSGGGDGADGGVGDSASATAAANSVQSAATSLAARAMDNLITMAAEPSVAGGGGSGDTGLSAPPPPPLTLRTANLNLTLSVSPASELGDTPFACDTASTPVEVTLPPGMMKLLSAAGQGTEDNAVGVIFTVMSLNLHGGTRANLSTAGPLVSFSLRQAGAALKVENLAVPINLTLPHSVANVGARPLVVARAPDELHLRRLNILLGGMGGESAAGRRLAKATANASSYVCAGQPTQEEAATLLEELLKTNDGSTASEVAELRAAMLGAGCDEAVECNYWVESTGAWSGANCRTTGLSDAGVGCSCDHLTDFIVVVVPTSWEEFAEYAVAGFVVNTFTWKEAMACLANPTWTNVYLITMVRAPLALSPPASPLTPLRHHLIRPPYTAPPCVPLQGARHPQRGGPRVCNLARSARVALRRGDHGGP